mgnify:CR=1 FL=1
MSQPHDGPAHESPTNTPRWVKVFGIIGIVLILVLGALHLTGRSLGGPGRHTPPALQGVQRP